ALLEEAVLGDVAAHQLARHPASPEDEHAVADGRELLVVRARAHDAGAGGGGGPHELEDLLAGADVDPLRRLVQEQDRGPRLEPPREQRLLLVPARQRAGWHARLGWAPAGGAGARGRRRDPPPAGAAPRRVSAR